MFNVKVSVGYLAWLHEHFYTGCLAWAELKVLTYTLLSENNVCAHGSGATIAPTKPANRTIETRVNPANGTTIIPIESTNITKDDSISGKYTTLRI